MEEIKNKLEQKLEFYYSQQKQYEGKQWIKAGLIFGGIMIVLNSIQSYTLDMFEFTASYILLKIVIWILVGLGFGIVVKYHLRMSIKRVKMKLSKINSKNFDAMK